MIEVLRTSWALLLGMMLLMVGNGMQGTLLGLRGDIEGFSTFEMSVVMSAYFLGFLGGSRMAPEMIRRVGHVRVFAALCSLISAILILYAAVPVAWIWVLMRVLIGFCFSAVYVTAESWLNNSSSNETRGQALSLYMIVQTFGVVSAQGILVLADPAGWLLFVIPSVLVSISFAPILLSIQPTPAFETTRPMSLRELIGVSPLGCMGMFLLGGAFASQFGMAAVYGAQSGLSVPQISLFVALFFVGATVIQYPLGWLSDRVDRRRLIMVASGVGALGAAFGMAMGNSYLVLLLAAFVIGGVTSPLYSLLLAYTNDFLEFDRMAAASGGLIFINGVGAIAGPLLTGWLMSVAGPPGFFLFMGALLLALSGYALWRMTRRPINVVVDPASYAPVMPSASPVYAEAAQEHAYETAQDEEPQAGATGPAAVSEGT